MAFQAGAIVSKITLDRSKFSAGVKAVKKQTKSLGGWVKKNSAQFKAMGMAAAAAGTAALVVFTKMVKKYVEVGDMVHKMALRTGFAAQTLSELAYAADISGADITMLEKGVKKMSKTIVDASYGLETYLRVFRSLGLDIDELLQMKPEEQFLKIGAAIAEMESDTLRTAAAVDIFGRSGTMLLPLFKEGAEGIATLREEAHRLGIIFDEEAAANAAKLKDAQTALKGSIQGLSMAILKDLIPVITDIVKKMTDWFVSNREHAGVWVRSLLGAFQFIARGIQGLLLAWQGLKTGVFTVAQAITESFVKIAEGLLWLAKLTPGTEIFYGEKLEELIKDLTIVSEGYREEKEKGIDTMANIIDTYEKFVQTLDQIKTKTKEAKEETKTLSETIIKTAVPAARKMEGVMMLAVEEMKSGAKEVKESWEDAFWKMASDAMLFTSSLSGLFNQMTENRMINIENEYEARRKAIEGSLMSEAAKTKAMEKLDADFEKKRKKAMRAHAARTKAVGIMEAIINTAAAVVEALPNLKLAIAVGILGAAQTALIAGQALPSFQRGGRIGKGEPGIVGERGTEIFVPERPGEIIPIRERAPATIGGVSLTFNPVFYLSTLDPQTARDVVREQIGPELLEMLKTKILLPEFQEVIGTR